MPCGELPKDYLLPAQKSKSYVIRGSTGAAMIIKRIADKLVLSAPAKVNLFLEVLGKRSDGYHEVQTLLCPISLFDQLTFEVRPGGQIEFQLQTPNAEQGLTQPSEPTSALPRPDPAWEIPSDDRNLVVRAVRQVQQALGTTLGCRIVLTKAIPAAAGLGGGSSDAAAAVVASLLGWRNAWDRQLATDICSALGSDVPFFLGDEHQIGLALATGRGESCQQLKHYPPLDLLLTHPAVGCSTQQVYLNYAKPAEVRGFCKIVAACESEEPKKIGAELFNALQFAASSLTDWIERQLQLFASCGAPHALMSGSGSSCFAVIDDASCVARVRQAAAECGLPRVYVAKAWYGDSIEHQEA
jgi:4-diphosphocytidyl-2-C-methyl-D-erythritol kinase